MESTPGPPGEPSLLLGLRMRPALLKLGLPRREVMRCLCVILHTPHHRLRTTPFLMGINQLKLPLTLPLLHSLFSQRLTAGPVSCHFKTVFTTWPFKGTEIPKSGISAAVKKSHLKSKGTWTGFSVFKLALCDA